MNAPRSILARLAARRSAAGFTVLEFAIALVVLVLAGVLLMRFVAPNSRSAVVTIEDRRASEIAEATTQHLLAVAGTDPSLAGGAHADDHNPHERMYYVTWTVDDHEPIASCKRITVTVCWPDPNSVHNVRLVAVTPESR